MSQEKIFQFRRRFDSLYWQQFLLTAGMVLLTLLLLGVSFYGLSYNDTVAERRSEMRQQPCRHQQYERMCRISGIFQFVPACKSGNRDLGRFIFHMLCDDIFFKFR